VREGSIESSGIQGVYLLKTIILVFTALMVLQGISLALKSVLRLAGVRPPPAPDTDADAGAEPDRTTEARG
jgi:TRAP-type mannitol/chloroaromatic compound transport system permease small subunit